MGMAVLTEAAAHGKQCLIGAPTYDQVRITWDEMRKAAGNVFNFRESRMEALAPNKGRVIFRSLDDPNNARGHTADIVALDEAAFCPAEAYHEVLRPMLLDTNGELWAYTTPNGFNWFHEQWDLAQSRDDSRAWQIPTVGARHESGRLVRVPHPLENPEIPWSEMESLAATMNPLRFRQEILAEFVAQEGQVFADFSRSRHVSDAVKFEHNLPTWVGIDFGYRTFAYVAVQSSKAQDVRIFDDAEWKNLTTQQALTRLGAMPWAQHVEMVACDPAGDGTNIQTGMSDLDLVRRAFPRAKVTFSTQVEHRKPEWRASRIRDLLWSAAGDTRLFVSPSCKASIRMFESSVYPKHTDGHAERPEPLKDGVNDHLRDALGYLVCNALYKARAAWV